VAAEDEAAEFLAAAPDLPTLEAMLARRLTGEPLAWITGTIRFCGLSVGVRPGVYVPRWQSEALARTAAELLPPQGTAVDLCTGSGAVALVLQAARPDARVIATESDPVAAACARDNSVDVRGGDLDDELPADLTGRVDVMTGVVPYVPDDALHLLPRDILSFEPRGALAGGVGGLEIVARAVARSTRWVTRGGWLLLEAGGGQFEEVARYFGSSGYTDVRVLEDGDGDPRAVCGRLGGSAAGPAYASSR
jgi:release factor glutamine methyltransferase